MTMSRYQELLQQRADLVNEGKAALAAAEGRALTAEEIAADDAREQKLSAINAELAVLERQRERERSIGADIPAVTGMLARTHNRAADKPWGYEIYRGDNAQRKVEAALGDQLLATYRARVAGQVDPRLTYQATAQGAGIASPEDGGYLLADQVSDAIMLRANSGAILQRVKRASMGSGLASVKINLIDESSRATGSRFGGVQAYWVDEGTAPSASRPKFFRESWEPHKLACLGYATDELLADAALVGSIMFQAFAEEVRFLTENAIIRGTGAGMPMGILNAPALISVSKETGQAAATIVYQNVVKMLSRLHASSLAGAVWLHNVDILPQLMQMNLAVGTGGVPVWMPAGGAADRPLGSLFGIPLVPTEYSATLGTVGDLMLVNLNEYFFIDRGAPEQATSMHVAFTTDEQAFRLTWRVDGHPLWRTALTPFQGSNTQSPFVALATRS